MPRNTRKSMSDPNPLYALAGAGDLAVEKIREISKVASDKIGSLETADPIAVSDRVQEQIEERADALALALRSASTDLRIQAKDLTDKAQSAVQSVLIQAGDTYDILTKRGKVAVIRMRTPENGNGQAKNGRAQKNGRQLDRTTSSPSRPKSTTTRKRTATKRTTTAAAGTRKTTRSAADGTAKPSTTKTAKPSTAKSSAAKSASAKKSTSAPAATTKPSS